MLSIISNFNSPTPPSSAKKRRIEYEAKKEEPDEVDKCIMGVAEQLKASIASASSSPNGQFGSYISAELKQLASPQRDQVKIEIMQIFSRIKYDKRGVTYQPDGNNYQNL